MSALDAGLAPHKHAKRNDPSTSKVAAFRLTNKATMLRRMLQAFAEGPLTAEEASQKTGITVGEGSWKRISDLDRLGYIEDTGERRLSSLGRPQMVRRITASGLRELGVRA